MLAGPGPIEVVVPGIEGELIVVGCIVVGPSSAVGHHVGELFIHSSIDGYRSSLKIGIGGLLQEVLRRKRIGNVADAREMKTPHPGVLGGDVSVRVQGLFEACGELAAIGGRKIGGGLIGGVWEIRKWGGGSGSSQKCKSHLGVQADRILFEAIDPVLLDGIVQKAEWKTVVEESEARSNDVGSGVTGTPGHS